MLVNDLICLILIDYIQTYHQSIGPMRVQRLRHKTISIIRGIGPSLGYSSNFQSIPLDVVNNVGGIPSHNQLVIPSDEVERAVNSANYIVMKKVFPRNRRLCIKAA